MQVLFAYKPGLDLLDPITIAEDGHEWRPGVFDKGTGLTKGPFRLLRVSGMTKRDLVSLCSPSVDEVEGVGQLERKTIEEKWWLWPTGGLPGRLRAAVRNGDADGRVVTLSVAEVLAWVSENPKVAEHKNVNRRVLWAPRLEPPAGKSRTEV